ncbi:MAG: [FeFe] hydrogenase H-cluster radical SAM maturase HydE [Bacteroidales bacterium]|nr:[FeFe] hydrogenase H-cluster radical SAM maturase HydE [Bacteroidales bacterium]
MIQDILNRQALTQEEIIYLLQTKGEERTLLFKKSAELKQRYIGNKVYFRGLIEFSNICRKDCLYCGIRRSNKHINRYDLTDEDILKAAEFAYKENYGSLVLQSGELMNNAFTDRVEYLLKSIKKLSNNQLGITISLGEQSEETYQKWFDAGAHRYLLRIESSNPELYYKIHPNNATHKFDTRIDSLKTLKKVGYQTGTGVMVGLPFQTFEDLAGDLLFMQELDIDMCGMGPYIEHHETPLYQYKDQLLPLKERFDLTLKMIAVLRILMPDINIAAATALQAIDPIGREKALKIGANILMPNITPGMYRDSYALYENKPCTDEDASDCKNCLEARIKLSDNEIGYNEWGDSPHFRIRNLN